MRKKKEKKEERNGLFYLFDNINKINVVYRLYINEKTFSTLFGKQILAYAVVVMPKKESKRKKITNRLYEDIVMHFSTLSQWPDHISIEFGNLLLQNSHDPIKYIPSS